MYFNGKSNIYGIKDTREICLVEMEMEWKKVYKCNKSVWIIIIKIKEDWNIELVGRRISNITER